MSIENPYPGVRTWKTQAGYRVFELLYEADPDKGQGEKTYVEDLKMDMSPWLYKKYTEMSDSALFRQEILCDFEATQGQFLFTFKQHEQAILEKPFIIPPHWTRYYGLDPHPRVPHAHLWCAVDPYGDRHYYREFWPSKQYGIKGNVPEDDNRHTIREHMQVVKYLESAENPKNSGADEKICRRVIDYAARAFGQGTSDDPEPQENFQLRFERTMRELKMSRPYFQDCIKDHDAGIERVNSGFKPIQVENARGQFVGSSRIKIFDNMHELILQLRTARYPQLTALQADTQDPTGIPMPKRSHLCDCIRYLEMANLKYIPPVSAVSDWKPLYAGVNF